MKVLLLQLYKHNTEWLWWFWKGKLQCWFFRYVTYESLAVWMCLFDKVPKQKCSPMALTAHLCWCTIWTLKTWGVFTRKNILWEQEHNFSTSAIGQKPLPWTECKNTIISCLIHVDILKFSAHLKGFWTFIVNIMTDLVLQWLLGNSVILFYIQTVEGLVRQLQIWSWCML